MPNTSELEIIGILTINGNKGHNDQLLIDKSSTPSNNSISPSPARQINENSKNTETVGENQNPDPADPVIVNKISRPIRSRKPPQRYSPSDYA
ncbi:unnamed protein product [Macrosiphum euphorbiae]|uniref:Uncharacterized protein n=1 Tax=Macrosiphum euphorbiae TaxID=13131 RepID=A0AAV0WVC1_9HEMI|nr:unnamed protein product [Macrosiphum euphorbiae]